MSSSFPPIRDAAFDQYWKHQTLLAVEFWRSREDATEVRALISQWILERAIDRSTLSPSGLVSKARIELPALLGERSVDLVPRFASLNRSSDDDPAAEWMLAIAAADAIGIETKCAVLTAALDLTYGPLGSLALNDELLTRVASDGELARKFDTLATCLTATRAQDPVGAVLSSQRALFESQDAEWKRRPDLGELLREPTFEVSFSNDEESFALRVLRHCNPPRYAELLSDFNSPQLLSDLLGDIRDDAQAIANLLRMAPASFVGNRWNESLVLPLALQTAFGHITDRLLRSPAVDDGNLERMTKETCELFVDTMAQRDDGVLVSLRWAVALLEELARRSREGLIPPLLRSAARAPWMLLDALSKAQSACKWCSTQLEDIAPDLLVLIHCVRILAAMEHGLADLPSMEEIIPWDVSNERDLAAAKKFVCLAPEPRSYLFVLLGWQLAQDADPSAKWMALWDRALPFRDIERYQYGTGLRRPDGSPIPKIVWGTGLHATFWLGSDHDDTSRQKSASALTAMLSDASLEQCLTRYVDEPFWDAASAHAVIGTAVSVKAGVAPMEEFARAISARIAATPEFFRILHSLIDNKWPIELVCSGIPGGRERLNSLIADAVAIGELDPQFAKRTSRAIQVVTEALRRTYLSST